MSSAPFHPRPAFVLGVTGHMDILKEDVKDLKALISATLLYLFTGKKEGKLSPIQLFDGWVPLKHTPIVILTSLAPGADSLVAMVAFELKEEKNWPITVKAVLPFLDGQYQRASTFTKATEAIGKEGWLGKPGEALQCYEALLAKIRAQAEGEAAQDRFVHTVSLQRDRDREATGDVLKDLLEENLEEGEENERLRHLRYKAAGEYIAAYSDLMFTIWDPVDEPEPEDEGAKPPTGVGTAAIIHAKRSGLSPGLLPYSSAFSCAASGPLVHFHIRRANPKNSKPTDNQPLAPANPPKTEFPPRILYPFRFRPVEILNKEKMLHEWKVLADEHFVGHAKCLEDFNHVTAHTPVVPGLAEEVPKEIQHRQELEFGDEIEESRKLILALYPAADESRHTECTESLAALLRICRRASRYSRSITQKYRKSTMGLLFWLTLVSATLLHFFSHWHASGHGDGHDHSPDTVRSLLLGGAVVFGLFGLWRFACYKLSGQESRDHDFRALAEGLRVQFFWAVSGLRSSVAANYMQRQRSETDWIRKAISSLASPYDRWRKWFQELVPLRKIQVLEVVHKEWILHQRNYFANSAKHNEQLLHVWHAVGAASAIGGMLLVLTGWICREHWPSWHQYAIWVGVAVGFGVLSILLVALYSTIKSVRKSIGSPTPKPGLLAKCCKLTLDAWNAFMSSWRESCLWLVHKWCPEVSHHGRDSTPWSLLKSFASHIPLAIGFAAVFLAVCIAGGKSWAIPDTQNSLIICVGFLLLAGAMCVAWAEKNLYAEHSRQYNSMYSLFRQADERMKNHHFALLDIHTAMGGGNPTAKARFAEEIAHIHEFLNALGKEALDENAEWLILHRARPLEPVLAG